VSSRTESDLARRAWRSIRALIASPDVVAAEHAFMHDVGLTAGPIRALRAMREVGPQSMRVLADRLGCDKSYVTSLVKPLLAKDLVTLEPDPSDGRVKVVTLTQKGSRLAERAQQVHESPPAMLGKLSLEDLQHLSLLLERAQGAVQRDDDYLDR